MIQWGEIYCLGVESIDKDHEEFFVLIEKAYDLYHSGRENIYHEIIELIKMSQGLAKKHFKLEQEFMIQIQYPHLNAHALEHSVFLAQMENINWEIIALNEKEYLLKMIDFIVEWILLHISTEDMKMARYYHRYSTK